MLKRQIILIIIRCACVNWNSGKERNSKKLCNFWIKVMVSFLGRTAHGRIGKLSMGIVCRHDQESAYISSRLLARLERKYIGMAGVCDGTMTFAEHKINLKQHAQMMLIIISRFSAIHCVKVHRYTLVSFMYSHRNKCTSAYYYWHGNHIVYIHIHCIL